MAKPSRRSVLRAGILVPAAAVPLATVDNAISLVAGGIASGLRRSTFAPHVRSSFSLAGGDETYTATLTRIADLARSPRGHDRKFRLRFDVAGAPEAGTYRLRHDRIGALDLFVAPVSGQAGVYEAVVDAR